MSSRKRRLTIFDASHVSDNEFVRNDIDGMSSTDHRELVLGFDFRLESWNIISRKSFPNTLQPKPKLAVSKSFYERIVYDANDGRNQFVPLKL